MQFIFIWAMESVRGFKSQLCHSEYIYSFCATDLSFVKCMRETAACPPSPAGTILQLHHLPPPLPPLGSDASCLFTWPAPVCQLLYCATILCWRRKQQPTPVLSPGESHGQRCLAGYSPWDGKSQTRLSDQTTTTTTTILSKALYCKIKNVFLLCVF